MHVLKGLFIGWLCILALNGVGAEELPAGKRTPLALYLTARQAHDWKQQAQSPVLLVDVRSKAEAVFLGMGSSVDALVPFQEFNGDGAVWDDRGSTYLNEPNVEFLAQMETLVRRLGRDKHSPIVLMCRSGGRSASAVAVLARAGYTRVYSVTDGYEGDLMPQGPQAGQRVRNGWRVEGLPWSYKLDKHKLPAH